MVEPGFWNFPLPGGIPEELLTPFAEFAVKNNINAAFPRMASISGYGSGGFNENTLTLDMVLAFGAPVTRDALNNSFFVPIGSNSLLYRKAYELLKDDVLLSSTIKETERKKNGVMMVVRTPNGDVLVKARRVLWTPYPSQNANLKTFDEDKKEREVFAKWVPRWQYVAVLHVPCVPENYSIDYIASAAVPTNYLGVRDHPYTFRVDSTGPSGLGLFRALFSANVSFTAEEAKTIIIKDIQKVVAAGTLNYTGECDVEFKAFADHNGVLWPYGRKAYEGGFVQKMNALQGYRSTWWTGRSFCGGYTSSVWTFTETVLGRLLEDLRKA